MKKLINLMLALLCLIPLYARQELNYKSLDSEDPIGFDGESITYKDRTIQLGPRAFFIDGQLSDQEAGMYPYVYNSVNEASKHLVDGTEENPMVLYLAPYVYWIDDPDDPEVRTAENGGTPFGLIIRCEWLRFEGLSEKAENVVLACNRGQTIGSIGNFTMFRFFGDGTSSENITFGNYCNVDLDYPLKPELSREKRASAIVQAQLIICNGDKIVARNTRFISRLNLCPFVGGKRVFFDSCHFESTDDALCGTGVYYNCTLDFYSSKPFYHTTGTGAVFLDCDFRAFTHGNQYFTKANGQVTVVDSRFHIDEGTYIGWRDIPPPSLRNYQFNVLKNGVKTEIGSNDPSSTIDMTGKKILDAYRFDYNGKSEYNLYNLLSGDDDWDPAGMKEITREASKELERELTGIPVQLKINTSRTTLETGKDEADLNALLFRFGNVITKDTTIHWSVESGDPSLVELSPADNGSTCHLRPVNRTDETRTIIIKAFTESGLEGAVELTIAPEQLPPPAFIRAPKIKNNKDGTFAVDYKLDMDYPDQSLVTWYRCSNAAGDNPIAVAVSRFDVPMRTYPLEPGDEGKYIKVTVEPKHQRCDAGEPAEAIYKKPVSRKDIKADPAVLYTDFKNLSTANQPEVLPGYWTMNHFDPAISDPAQDAWYYGTGRDGAAGISGLIQGRSASLSYTPTASSSGDMKATLTIAPYKSAGQGFSIAGLYMDVLIKYDALTKSGVGLRLIRTTKYGNAVDCILIKYENGKVVEISEPITTSAYRTPFHLELETTGDHLEVHARTLDEDFIPGNPPGVVHSVEMEADIPAGTAGGFGIEYYGGASAVIQALSIEWK